MAVRQVGVFGLGLALKYLKLRETKNKDIAMTLANKTHCKSPGLVQGKREDGFEFLYESQMKNNDKEFQDVIERLKKNIPNSQVDKYAMRRMRSNELFRDHNEVPYTKGPDNFYYQNTKEKNSFIFEDDEIEKYLEEMKLEEDLLSDPGAEDNQVNNILIFRNLLKKQSL